MSKSKDVEVDFSKKKITPQNMYNKLVKYCQTQRFIAGDIKSLVYSDNSLNDICTFDMFTNLQTILLSNNNFKIIPSNLSTISNLKHLNLSYNKLDGSEDNLLPLTNLTYLDLSYNSYTTFSFTHLSTLTNLKTFKLTNNQLTTFNYDCLKQLKSVNEFYINANYIDAPTFKEHSLCHQFPSPFFQCVPNQITERIYLGSLDSTRERDRLLERNIKGVLSLGAKAIVVSKKIKVEFIDILDEAESQLDMYFKQCFLFIDSILETGANVLVHCHAGVSRSSTVVLAYLMYKNMWTYKQATEFVKKNRPIITPNSGFDKQLQLFEAKLFKLANRKSGSGIADSDSEHSVPPLT